MEEKLNEEKMSSKVKKNQTAKVGEKYSYKYVDIAQIHDYLENNGIYYYQYIDRINDDDYIMTVPIINSEVQEARRGCRVVDATLYGVDNPAQQQGSALTYARRYSLLMAFGLATEDDDAQSLSKPKEEQKASPKQVELLNKYYKGDNLTKLLEANEIEKLEDLSIGKASEIISVIMKKGKK